MLELLEQHFTEQPRGVVVIDSDEDALIRLAFDLKQVWRGDWMGALMVLLRRGRMQYRDIRDEMAGYAFHDPWTDKKRSLSNSELSRTLTRMTDDGWLIRTETPGEWHPNVSYALSDAGQEAIEGLLTGLLSWSRHNQAFFARALRRRGRLHAADERDTPHRSTIHWRRSQPCAG